VTRREVLLRLIALEPIGLAELYQVCGWPVDEVDATLRELRAEGAVVRYVGSQLQLFTVAP
jgi:hypothetical protein